MYIAVKGGEAAIDASQQRLDAQRRGDPAWPAIANGQVRQQLRLLVDRVMTEGSLYDPELAALAVQQAQGDVVEAVFLLRAYRTTLPRLGHTCPLALNRMQVQRRVSAVYKDIPGGQLLGASFDYTQRLLDFRLLAEGPGSAVAAAAENADDGPGAGSAASVAPLATADLPSALSPLVAEGLLEAAPANQSGAEPPDITRQPPLHPLPRSARLQMLARADEGWVLGLGYATQRGYANSHPFAGEIRIGQVPVALVPEELGFAVEIGQIELTDCQMLHPHAGSDAHPPQFVCGQGVAFGQGERKAMAMALVDRALRADEFGDERGSPTQDAEFVLSHGDSVEASGFVQHLKLPHYVTFESELQLLRSLKERP